MENVTSLNEHNAASPAATLQLTCMFKFVVLQTGSSFLDLPTSIVSIVSAILAIMGNTLILISLFRTASIAPPSKVLLGSLALTDLGVGLLAQPLYIVKSLSSDKDTKCFLGLLFDLLSGHLSITSFFTMMFISVDKFLALHLKLRYRIVVTLKRSILVVVLVRLVALPWSLSYIWFSEVYFMLILSIMPWCLLISSLAFIKIHRILRRQKRTYQNETQLESVRRANILKISRYKKSVNSMLRFLCAVDCIRSRVDGDFITNHLREYRDFENGHEIDNDSYTYELRLQSHLIPVEDGRSACRCFRSTRGFNPKITF